MKFNKRRKAKLHCVQFRKYFVQGLGSPNMLSWLDDSMLGRYDSRKFLKNLAKCYYRGKHGYKGWQQYMD